MKDILQESFAEMNQKQKKFLNFNFSWNLENLSKTF